MQTPLSPQIIVSRKDLLLFSHRGYGKKAAFRYQKKEGLQSVDNQLTGFELGIERGADTLEVDLSKTKDGKIVTAHGLPWQSNLDRTEEEYLKKYPEAFTFLELIDWIYHQHEAFSLYLELKSPITLKEILEYLNDYTQTYPSKEKNKIYAKLYKQLMFYTHKIPQLEGLIKEKQQYALSTNQFRIWWVSFFKLMTKGDIDRISQIGNTGCRMYGVELGMLPWGRASVNTLFTTPLIHVYPFAQVQSYYNNLSKLVAYAKTKKLYFIVGTNDNPFWIRNFIKQGVHGIASNNPYNFLLAGIKRKEQFTLRKESETYYIPQSMKKRLHL